VWWLVWTLLAVGILVLAALTVRDQRTLIRMSDLAARGLHEEVLDHPLPSRRNRRTGQAIQATSAVLTGQFALALELLGTAPRPVRGFPSSPAVDELLRGSALCGLGRYEQAAALLGDCPADTSLGHVRAQAAIEVGDDALAERLLAHRAEDPLDEAGRLRLLGELHVRRGRLAEGEALVRQAQAAYAAHEQPGTDVDEALCTLLLGRARQREGRPAEAAPILDSALRGLQQRPDNAPGLAYAHGLVAEAQAGVGDAAGAAEHLRCAREQAARCGSDALDAEVARATAMVAVRLGQRTEARDLLHEALRRHEALGARPVADELRVELAALSD
jgi:tetratricopeptide (TPR) repeat protein